MRFALCWIGCHMLSSGTWRSPVNRKHCMRSAITHRAFQDILPCDPLFLIPRWPCFDVVLKCLHRWAEYCPHFGAVGKQETVRLDGKSPAVTTAFQIKERLVAKGRVILSVRRCGVQCPVNSTLRRKHDPVRLSLAAFIPAAMHLLHRRAPHATLV